MLHKLVITVTIALCSCISFAAAQEAADSDVDSGGINNGAISVVDTVNTVDTVGATKDLAGSKDVINLDDDELLQSALFADSVKTAPSAQKLDLIRREYEYKRQTRAAIVMMIFIAVAMATSQSWNPK